MDVQIKKGLSEALVLYIVSQGDIYGYKLVQDLSEVIPLSESTLYPILRRLESQGFVGTYSQEYNGRLRKYYRITESGRARCQEYREQWKEAQKAIDFLLKGEET